MTTTVAAARDQLADGMTETTLQRRVTELARALRWTITDPRRLRTGFPGLVLVRGPQLLWRVVLSATGELSPEQTRWLDALTKTNADVAVWRPADLLGGTVHTDLTKEPKAP